MAINMSMQSSQKRYFISFHEFQQNYRQKFFSLWQMSLHRRLNSETSKTALRKFCDLYELRNLLREPTSFKNPDNLLCVNLFLTNCSRSFQGPQVIQTGLSDFSQNESSSYKSNTKQKHENIFYRNYKTVW